MFATMMNVLGADAPDRHLQRLPRPARHACWPTSVYRLEQDQYQTADLLIIGLKRGLAGDRAPDRVAPGHRARPRRARTGSSASATDGWWPARGGGSAACRGTT